MTNARGRNAASAPPGVDPATGEITDDATGGGSPLVAAAMANGAIELQTSEWALPMELAAIPELRASDIFPSPEKWSMYPQVDRDTLVGKELVLIDCMFLPSLEYEDREWAILQVMPLDTREVITTSMGSEIVLSRLHALKETERKDGKVGYLPIRIRIDKHPSSVKGHSDYYSIV